MHSNIGMIADIERKVGRRLSKAIKIAVASD